MSQEFVDVMAHLQQARVLDMNPESEFCYYHDGQALDLPVVRRITKRPLKTEHWAPVCFRLKEGV
jgi:hypothetical protein